MRGDGEGKELLSRGGETRFYRRGQCKPPACYSTRTINKYYILATVISYDDADDPSMHAMYVRKEDEKRGTKRRMKKRDGKKEGVR